MGWHLKRLQQDDEWNAVGAVDRAKVEAIAVPLRGGTGRVSSRTGGVTTAEQAKLLCTLAG
jgi:hypothetical protein